MSDQLDQLLLRLSQEQALLRGVEEVTRQGAVLPVLAQLGWDVYNIRQVVPEFPVEGSRVDYCLRHGERNLVFIEVKRTSEELDKHEKQLLEYSFKHGVDIAVLTNGLLWWFYLPLAPGSWEQRKFFTIDIRKQDTSAAAAHFREFLQHNAVTDGSARTKTQSLQASRERDRLLAHTIRQVWDQLLTQPDEDFLELLADKVESTCGYRPDPDMLSEHILASAKPVSAIKPLLGPVQHGTDLQQNATGEPGQQTVRASKQRGVTVHIDGHRIEATSVPNLYRSILAYLIESGHINKFTEHIPYATSGLRYLIAREPHHQGGNVFRVAVEHKGYYMEAHKDYSNALNHLADFLKLGGLKLDY